MTSEKKRNNEALYDIFGSKIFNDIIKRKNISKTIINILGGTANILTDYLLRLHLDEQQLNQVYELLSENTSIVYPRSNLFSSWRDQHQYIGIYDAIKCVKAQVPEILIKEISEFSVGKIKKCDNFDKCQNEILILHSDYSKSTQLEFNETANCLLHYWFDEMPKLAVAEIGYFQCNDKIFCKSCVTEGRNAIDYCYKCSTLCCTHGFQCSVCENEWFPGCNSCLKFCSLCGITTNVADKTHHGDCHQAQQCVRCNKKFCAISTIHSELNINNYPFGTDWKNIPPKICNKCKN
eukprot:372637_1